MRRYSIRFLVAIVLIFGNTGCALFSRQLHFEAATPEQEAMIAYILKIEKEAIENADTFSTDDFIATIYHDPKAMAYIESETLKIEAKYGSYEAYFDQYEGYSAMDTINDNLYDKRKAQVMIIDRLFAVYAVDVWNKDIDLGTVYVTSHYSGERKNSGVFFYTEVTPRKYEQYIFEGTAALMRGEYDVYCETDEQIMDLTRTLDANGNSVGHFFDYPRGVDYEIGGFSIYNKAEQKVEIAYPPDLADW